MKQQSAGQRILAVLAASSQPLSAAQLAGRLGFSDTASVHCAVKRMRDHGQENLYMHKQTCAVTNLYRQHYWIRDWTPEKHYSHSAPGQLSRASRRGNQASANVWRGEKPEVTSWGQIRISKRNRFPSDNPSLQGRYDEITLAQKLRLELWAMRA